MNTQALTVIDILNKIVLVVGAPVLGGSLIYIGRKFEILDRLEKTIDTIKYNIRALEYNFKAVVSFLTKNSTLELDPVELRGYSPLNLTSKGIEVIEHLKFDEIVRDHKDDFFTCITDDGPKLKYDVELSAIKSIYMLSDKPYMAPIKIFLYNKPSRRLENLAPTLGVYVRDRYLAEHPEITE